MSFFNDLNSNFYSILIEAFYMQLDSTILNKNFDIPLNLYLFKYVSKIMLTSLFGTIGLLINILSSRILFEILENSYSNNKLFRYTY